VPVELKRFPDQIHGFLNAIGSGRSSRAAMREIAAKLKAALT
jgi:acetyl esterase